MGWHDTSKAGIEFVKNNDGSTLLISRRRRPESENTHKQKWERRKLTSLLRVMCVCVSWPNKQCKEAQLIMQKTHTARRTNI